MNEVLDSREAAIERVREALAESYTIGSWMVAVWNLENGNEVMHRVNWNMTPSQTSVDLLVNDLKSNGLLNTEAGPECLPVAEEFQEDNK